MCAAFPPSANRQFAASSNKIKNCWIDNALELVNACRVLGYRHHPSTENRPQSNGVAERSMRRILEGTRAALHDSGLNRRYWHLAMRCYCTLHNIVDVWKLDKTHYELRFTQKFKCQLMPFGSKVYYMPTSKNKEDKRPKFDPRFITGIFVGYKLYPGGVWRYEYLVIDFEAFQAIRAGTAPDDKEQPSFPVRAGAIRPLSSDGLTDQTSPRPDVP